jgi:hypothetical protein
MRSVDSAHKNPEFIITSERTEMPAIETFDWLKMELWPTAQNDLRLFLEEKRKYLLTIRNENERRRFVEELLSEVRSRLRTKNG